MIVAGGNRIRKPARFAAVTNRPWFAWRGGIQCLDGGGQQLTPSGLLPPVVSAVLYNGEGTWTAALIEWLQASQQADLRRAFVSWLRQVLIPRRMPEAEVPELEDLQEVRTMLAERVKEWERQWMRKGRQEGRQEGRAELIVRLLERRFGTLDAGSRQRIAQADTDRLFAWGERVLTAERLEDVLD